MVNLIDKTYFWGEGYIAGLFTNTSGSSYSEYKESIEDELNKFIAKYQKDYLEQMFGIELAKNLPKELIDLVINTELKISPIADYVFYFYSRSKETFTTPMGEKKLTTQNSVIAQAIEKRKNVYNEGVKVNRKIHLDLYNKEVIEIASTENSEAYSLKYSVDIMPKIDFNSDIFNFCLSL